MRMEMGGWDSMSLWDGSGGRVQGLSGTGEGWHKLMLQEERMVLLELLRHQSQVYHLVELRVVMLGWRLWWTRWW